MWRQVTVRGDGIIGRVGALLLLAVLVMCTGVAASSAATPPWYPQLRLAVVDARGVGVAMVACMAPRAASPKAGRTCAITQASDDSGKLNEVSVYAETGEVVGPCKRLLFALDHVTTAQSAMALAFAKQTTMSMAKDVSGRRALVQGVTQVSADFKALQHCLGKA